MISGQSISASSLSGSYRTRTIVIRLPVTETIVSAIAPSVSSGASVFLPVTETEVQAYAPKLAYAINLPVTQTIVSVETPSVAGGASIFLPATFTIVEGKVPSLEFIVRGVPDWYPDRISGTQVDLIISNREGKDVAVLRSDEHNLSFTQVDVATADTYNDTGLTATKNYKYKLQFVSRVGSTITAKGIKSISKFTKHG